MEGQVEDAEDADDEDGGGGDVEVMKTATGYHLCCFFFPS